MVTHDVRVAAAADRVLVMEDGCFTRSTAADATAATALADLDDTGTR
jgi:ABC-type lipoprotein export system ATPase subunit